MALFGFSQVLYNAYQALLAKFPLTQSNPTTVYQSLAGASTGANSNVGLAVLTLTTRGGWIYANLYGDCYNDSFSQPSYFAIALSGVVSVMDIQAFSAPGNSFVVTVGGRILLGKPGANTYTVTLYWRTGVGSVFWNRGGWSIEEVAGD